MIKVFLSRSQLKLCLKKAFVNSKEVKLSKKLKLGDKLELWIEKELESKIVLQDIPLNVVFENEDVLVIDKEQGMVVHPGSGNKDGTLVNAVLSYIKKDEFNDLCRAGIVHRLDKDTSGLIIVAKNLSTLEYLQSQFKNRTVVKKYFAITKGSILKTEGEIEGYIFRDKKNRKKFILDLKDNRGKYSYTKYSLLKRDGNYNLLRLEPKTGRTHQLRVHLKSISNPILGDKIYSNNKEKNDYNLMLHAYSLSISIKKGEENKKFSSPIPKRFSKVITYDLQSYY